MTSKIIAFLTLLMLASVFAGSQTPSSSPRITDLFSPDEVKKAGLQSSMLTKSPL